METCMPVLVSRSEFGCSSKQYLNTKLPKDESEFLESKMNFIWTVNLFFFKKTFNRKTSLFLFPYNNFFLGGGGGVEEGKQESKKVLPGNAMRKDVCKSKNTKNINNLDHQLEWSLHVIFILHQIHNKRN